MLRLADVGNERLLLSFGDVLLFEYVYSPVGIDPTESPKPYFHPIRTLAGNVVTAFRPPDHEWHKGLAMTATYLSGENFFGPKTYVHGRGYMPLENVGRIQHERWDEISSSGGRARAIEGLDWITQAGERWITERRLISVSNAYPEQGCWALDLRFDLRNTRGADLVFGSPTTRGRPQAGYGGLFWRGPESFRGGKILAGDGSEGPQAMGRRAPWLAYVGEHEDGQPSTLVLIDRPTNPRYPTKWFVRNDQYAGASVSLTFDEELVLPAGKTLRLDYRVVLADGAWPRERIDPLAGEAAAGGAVHDAIW